MRPDLPAMMRKIAHLEHVKPDRWAKTFELYGTTPDQVSQAVEDEIKRRAEEDALRALAEVEDE